MNAPRSEHARHRHHATTSWPRALGLFAAMALLALPSRASAQSQDAGASMTAPECDAALRALGVEELTEAQRLERLRSLGGCVGVSSWLTGQVVSTLLEALFRGNATVRAAAGAALDPFHVATPALLAAVPTPAAVDRAYTRAASAAVARPRNRLVRSPHRCELQAQGGGLVFSCEARASACDEIDVVFVTFELHASGLGPAVVSIGHHPSASCS